MLMSIPINNTNTLSFNPGDWVKVIKKPRSAIAIVKGDIIQADGVNPKAQMIRTLDPEMGWQHLGFDEIQLAVPAPEPVVTGTTELSVRERQRDDTPQAEKALIEIRKILNQLDVSVRDDVIEKIVSSRDDIVDNDIASIFNDSPKIVWRSPGGRTAKYPWFEFGKLRAYIGGGDRHSPVAQKRVEIVQQWIDGGILPTNIYRRVKSKQFCLDNAASKFIGESLRE